MTRSEIILVADELRLRQMDVVAGMDPDRFLKYLADRLCDTDLVYAGLGESHPSELGSIAFQAVAALRESLEDALYWVKKNLSTETPVRMIDSSQFNTPDESEEDEEL